MPKRLYYQMNAFGGRESHHSNDASPPKAHLVALLHFGKGLLCAVQELHACSGSIHLGSNCGAELRFVGLMLLGVLL